MFHICFAADENYIKYTAVLITSIVKSTDTSRKFGDFFASNLAQNSTANSTDGGGGLNNYKKLDYNSLSDDEKSEGYIFHILTDKISENTRQKLEKLAQNLSEIYPCEIEIHICDDAIFQGLPSLNGNYITYFRLLIPNFMPANAKTCLYLDTDMLVMQDLRVLFALDLTDKIVGVVKDKTSCLGKRRQKNPHDKDFVFKGFYFNAGFLLINLDEWRKQNVAQQCLDFMDKYEAKWHDQDALNATISHAQALVLPFEYNCLADTYLYAACNDDKRYFKLDYPRKALKQALSNPAILHYTPYKVKAWSTPYHFVDTKGKALGLYWWDIAQQTPYFKDEFKLKFNQMQKSYLANKDFLNYLSFLMIECSKNFFGYIKMPFIVHKAFKEKGDFDKAKIAFNPLNFNQDEYNLASELAYIATLTFQRKRIGRKISLPYEAFRIKYNYKKYRFKDDLA